MFYRWMSLRLGWIKFRECGGLLNIFCNILFKLKKAFVENKRTNSSELCEVGDVVSQRDMFFAGE